MRRLLQLLLTTTIASCSPPQAPAVPVTPQTATLVVRDVYISTPERVPSDEIEPEYTTLAPVRATVELTVSVPMNCDAAAFAVEELEGSILGSDGIETAVTYFVPRLAAERCTPAPPREYVLSLRWMRRSDTPWTIVVAPYTGTADRLAGTALFARALTRHVASRPPRQDAIAVKPAMASLANGPAIKRVVARRDGGMLFVDLDLVYGNPCLARTQPWHLAITSSRVADSGFLWATLVRSAFGVCGEVYLPTPVTARYRVTVPDGVRTVSLAIPNVATKSGLPIFQKTFATGR